MAQNAFGMASLYDPTIAVDQQELDRRQQMADLLRRQSMTPIDANARIGNIAYKVSPLEAVAKVFQAYQAKKMDEDNLAKRNDLSQKQQKAMTTMVDSLTGAPSPVPQLPQDVRPQGVTSEAMAAGGFPQPPDATPQQVAQRDAVMAGNAQLDEIKRRAKAAYLMGNNELGNALLKNAFELTNEQKNWVAQGINPREMGQYATQKARGEAAAAGLQNVGPDQTIYDPTTNQARFTAPSAPSPQGRMMGDLLRGAGIDPASPQGRQAYANFITKETTHQPPVSVSVNTEKGYLGELAQGLAKQDLAIIDAAKSAPERITNSRAIKDLLDQAPITGSGANQRLALEKALSAAGLVDGKRVANTETLVSMLAASTLDAVKTSGLGSGQGFTNEEREFLEKARSGNITINPTTLRTLAEMNERAALALIGKANNIIGRLQKNPNMGSVGPSIDKIEAPANTLRFDAQGNLVP